MTYRIRLTHRQRQILKSALLRYDQEYQPTPIDAILGALSKAGIGISNEIVRAYEKYRQEYESQVRRWINRILISAGVMPRDLWCIGVPATQLQLDMLAEELGIVQFPSALITDAQARAMIEILETIRPKRANKWMKSDEINNIRKLCTTVDGINKCESSQTASRTKT